MFAFSLIILVLIENIFMHSYHTNEVSIIVLLLIIMQKQLFKYVLQLDSFQPH